MKCIICGKQFDGSCCPRCGFPVVESTDVDALLSSMHSQFDDYRQEFLEKISLGIVMYRWKEENGSIVLDQKEKRPFGKYSDLYNKETWISEKLARIPEEEKLNLLVYLSTEGNDEEISVSIPNLLDAALQQIGVEVRDDLSFRIKLRNDHDKETASDWISIM